MITVISRVTVSKRIVHRKEFRGVTSSSFFVCAEPPLKYPRFRYPADFRGPLGMMPPSPTPAPPGFSARVIVVMTGSGASGTAIEHVGRSGGGRGPLRDVIAQLKTGFVLRLSQRDSMGRIERNRDGAVFFRLLGGLPNTNPGLVWARIAMLCTMHLDRLPPLWHFLDPGLRTSNPLGPLKLPRP